MRFLVTEIYKSATQINPEFMWPYFTYNNITYNLRKWPILYLPSTHSTHYRTNSVYFRGSPIWNNLPWDIKSTEAATEGVLWQKRPATLFKKRLWHRCFPLNFWKFLKIPFLQNTSGRLLLNLANQHLNLIPKLRTLEILIADV